MSLRKEADGWWASIKEELPAKQLLPAVPGSVCGIDVGLDNIAAISEIRVINEPEEKTFAKQGEVLGQSMAQRISNPRGKVYAERIAGRQAAKKPVGRLQQAAAKQVKHLIHNEIIKPLATVELIKVEDLTSKIGQMGSAKTSAMRLIVSMLLERYGARDENGQPCFGNRMRAVEPHYTSQDCSQCGFRSKESWSYEHGRFGKCPSCGFNADRDVNAARNVAAKPSISLAS